MPAHKPRLPGDAKISELVRGNQQREATTRRLSPEALQQRMRQSLSVSNPRDNSQRLTADRECQIQLRITDIDPYDRNPRRSRNELYAEIKESIRAATVISPITVTKRPGSSRYMVGAGGNTRLKAQRELWDETGDPRFEYLLVTYRPWVSEAHVLTAHLVENELHASMSFWDKAVGVGELKQELELAAGKALSLRQLQEAVKQEGLSLSVTLLSFYGFALAKLSDLGPATRLLSTNAVRDLQPVFAFLGSYLAAHGRSEEDWDGLRAKVLRQHAQSLPKTGGDETDPSARSSFDATALIERLDAAVARHLAQEPAQVREVRQLMKTVPGAKLSELLERCAPGSSEAPSRQNPSATEAMSAAEPVADNTSGAVASITQTASTASSSQTPPPAARGAIASREAQPDPMPKDSEHEQSARSVPVPLSDVQQAAMAFAQACELDDLVRICDAMPAGFFVEAPSDGQAIDTDHRTLRYGAWWILAMHSGQIDGSYSERMPADSPWRQAQRMEAGQDANALPWLIETVLGSPIGLVELGMWLTDCPAPVFERYHEMIFGIRRLRSDAPDRFMLDGGDR